MILLNFHLKYIFHTKQYFVCYSRTGIPTYKELVACARNKTFMEEHGTSAETSTDMERSAENPLLEWNHRYVFLLQYYTKFQNKKFTVKHT